MRSPAFKKLPSFIQMDKSFNRLKALVRKNRTAILIAAVYSTPLVVYVLKSGSSLSTPHQIWGEFGSAMAGIYAPIIALTTLVVLVRQTNLQSQINRHQYDQTYISQARTDIDFYAAQLSQKLDAFALPGLTIREFLHKNFQRPNLTDIDAADMRTLAANLDHTFPSILTMWGAIYPIFAGLETRDDPFLNMTKQSSLQKLVALLSFETCVCLENYYRVRTEGKLNVSYQFSTDFKPKNGV